VKRVDVAVVGGGLAGLAAALWLADRGARVALVEKRRRLGGLTWSFEREGRWFDNGQHVFLRCCHAYRGFLARIGAVGDVVVQDRLRVPVLSPSGRRAVIARDRLPAPAHLARALLGYRHLSVADRLRLGPAAWALLRLDPEDPALDRESFGAWLARHHQRPQAVTELWDLIVRPTVNLPAEEASLAMAARVFRTGLLDQADAGDIGWASVPLGDLHGRRAATALQQAGVEVSLGGAVASLERARGGWQLGFADGSLLAAEAVVLAVPPGPAAALAPAGSLPAVERLGASPIVDVQLVLDRRVTEEPFFGAVGSPVQFVFDRTRAAGVDPGAGQVLAVSLSAADDWVGRRPEACVAEVRGGLEALIPRMARARVLDAVVTKEQQATIRARPGTAAARPHPGLVAPGLAVAGAWCQTGWPSTMEGAVRSGWEAAGQVLATLAGRAPSSRPSSVDADPLVGVSSQEEVR
jgi:squalene-associated FAD-dependent desaturase